MIRPLSLLCASLLSASAFAAPQTYNFDPFHSYPSFSVEHLGMATMRGRFDKMSGKATLDLAAKTGTVEIKIVSASLSTGDGARADGKRSRDDHLRSPDFFNVAEYPEITFRSTRLNFKGEELESVEGNLTLLGVTKPLKLTVTHFKCAPHPFSKAPMCGADMEGVIKRSDWGMKFGAPVAVSDNVKLQISLEAHPG